MRMQFSARQLTIQVRPANSRRSHCPGRSITLGQTTAPAHRKCSPGVPGAASITACRSASVGSVGGGCRFVVIMSTHEPPTCGVTGREQGDRCGFPADHEQFGSGTHGRRPWERLRRLGPGGLSSVDRGQPVHRCSPPPPGTSCAGRAVEPGHPTGAKPGCIQHMPPSP
jgi:hypothetical protein